MEESYQIYCRWKIMIVQTKLVHRLIRQKYDKLKNDVGENLHFSKKKNWYLYTTSKKYVISKTLLCFRVKSWG